MKTKTNKIRMMIATFAVLTVTMTLTIAATSAMAGPRLDTSAALEMLRTSDLDRLSEIIDTGFNFELIPGAVEVPVPDQGLIPDGGGWEPVFPEHETIPIPDGGAWEPVFPEGVEDEPAPSEPVDEPGDDEVVDEPADEPVDEPADEPVDEPVADEPAEEMTAQEEPQAEDEALELPFTGGDSTPWLIAGAAIVLAGIIVLVGRRGRKETR